MSKKKYCISLNTKQDIRNALIRSGVPINNNAISDNENGEFNTDYISNITRCDARCQEENKRDEVLRLTYINAKKNVITAPKKRDFAEKIYYTTAFGQGEYNDMQRQKYDQEIKMTTYNEREKFNNQKTNLLLLLDNYDKNILLNNKINELTELTLIENNKLIEKIDKINSTINTNERKTYYNSQQLDNLKKWKKYTLRFLLLVYIRLTGESCGKLYF